MLQTLSKAQKKAARSLIDLALERECQQFIRVLSDMSQKPLEPVDRPNHSRYLELFKSMDSFDKRLVQRYDGITGGRYLETVAFLFAEGWLTEDDLALCDDEMREEILRYNAVLTRMRE